MVIGKSMAEAGTGDMHTAGVGGGIGGIGGSGAKLCGEYRGSGRVRSFRMQIGALGMAQPFFSNSSSTGTGGS
jgi:hypothetical protein